MSALPLVLVQGATGLSGVPLVEKLSASGKVRIRATTRNPSNPKSLQLASLPNVELFQCDFSNADSVNESFKDVDRAFLLNKWGLGDLNVFRENYVAAIKNNKSCQFVLRYSGIGVTPDVQQESSKDHYIQEEAVKKIGIPYTIVRPGAFAESLLVHLLPVPADRTIRSILGKNANVANIAMDDIAEFCSIILIDPTSHNGKTYTITGPVAYPLADICTMISSLTGKPLFYREVDEETYKAILLNKGFPGFIIPFLLGLLGYLNSGKLNDVDTEDFEKIVGRKPITITQWLQQRIKLWE